MFKSHIRQIMHCRCCSDGNTESFHYRCTLYSYDYASINIEQSSIRSKQSTRLRPVPDRKQKYRSLRCECKGVIPLPRSAIGCENFPLDLGTP